MMRVHLIIFRCAKLYRAQAKPRSEVGNIPAEVHTHYLYLVNHWIMKHLDSLSSTLQAIVLLAQ